MPFSEVQLRVSQKKKKIDKFVFPDIPYLCVIKGINSPEELVKNKLIHEQTVSVG